jgi:Zn-dependent peptidase ImmA (M78 family)/transcriptional regulator with XRE-family HTH domain
MINGERVKQARELRGFTQKELADKINTTQPTIAQIENGIIISPSDAILQRIVLSTGFPSSFFKQPTFIDFPIGSLIFRARASMTLHERNVARQYARTIFEVAEKMEKNFEKIPLHLPCTDNDDVIGSAIQTRSSLGLSPDSPINNLVNTIEQNGVMVIALPIGLSNQDAFSVWVGRRPVIILSGVSESGDRLRFNVAHEIGHLVMHRAMVGDIKRLEEEANEFAGEFLMPKEAMATEIRIPITLTTLIPLKRRWKVSIQALIRRAYKLAIITQRQYKYLMQQLSSRGWKLKEPIDIPREKPRLISQMAEKLYGFPMDYKTLSSDMNLSLQMVQEMIEAHTVKNAHNATIRNPNATLLKFKKTDTENIEDIVENE